MNITPSTCKEKQIKSIKTTPLLNYQNKLYVVQSIVYLEDNSNAYKLIEEPLNSNSLLPPLSFVDNLLFKKDIAIIDSIQSGKGANLRGAFYENVIFPILTLLNNGKNTENLIKYKYFKTTSSDSMKYFARRIISSKKHEGDLSSPEKTVLILSGDTSISEFLNNLPPDQTPLKQLNILPIPLGTANAWCNCILKTNNPTTVFQNFLYNEYRPSTDQIPLYKVIFPGGDYIFMFIIFSMGFHANLLSLTTNDEKYKHLGIERFKLASKDILDHYDLNISIKIGGADKFCNYSYFALLNLPKLEENYTPSPISNPLISSLQLLGYKSSLLKKGNGLIDAILNGYNTNPNEIKNFLSNTEGVVTKSFNKDFDIEVDLPDNDKHTKFEACVDVKGKKGRHKICYCF
ncbi:uncharacterized protein SCODWIG_00743 [Saccharomycodes ludwigii]|uniref:DAGKc domain-containing protein n=1 Tax=Saccharomycodes ludwigii TaxID=36035 RepID=A0A376B2Z3_9ASCO|nr:uncharacterized protein SCODWIG_00743 [Saccharomycodes ludwigii]